MAPQIINAENLKKFVDSPEGRAFVQSKEGQDLLKEVAKISTEELSSTDKLLQQLVRMQMDAKRPVTARIGEWMTNNPYWTAAIFTAAGVAIGAGAAYYLNAPGMSGEGAATEAELASVRAVR